MEDDLSNALKAALDAEGIMIVEIPSREGVDITDSLGGMAMTTAMRQIFNGIIETTDILKTACLAMSVLPEERRKNIADLIGIDFKALREICIRLYKEQQAIYEACGPTADDDPQLIERFMQMRKHMREERAEFARMTQNLQTPGTPS